MDGIVGWARAGLVALLMLGAMACSDDDEGPVVPSDVGESNAEGGDSGASDDVDVCSLLELADVEAVFGDRGTVTQESSGCDWQVGEFGRSGTGSINVVDLRTFGPIEEDYDISWDVADNPVAVDGVGDEAFFDLMDPLGSGEFTSDDSAANLTFRTGDVLVMVQANFFDLEVDPEQESGKLIALAEQMLERL